MNQQLASDQLLFERDCPLCHAKKPIYAKNCLTCRARFLIGQPNNETRRGWIERWRKTLDEATIDEIRELTWKGINQK